MLVAKGAYRGAMLAVVEGVAGCWGGLLTFKMRETRGTSLSLEIV